MQGAGVDHPHEAGDPGIFPYNKSLIDIGQSKSDRTAEASLARE